MQACKTAAGALHLHYSEGGTVGQSFLYAGGRLVFLDSKPKPQPLQWCPIALDILANESLHPSDHFTCWSDVTATTSQQEHVCE